MLVAAGYWVQADVKDRSLLPGDEAELGEILFDDWLGRTAHPIPNASVQPAASAGARTPRPTLKENEFRVGEVPAASVLLVDDCAVFNIEGGFCATQAMCPHRQGEVIADAHAHYFGTDLKDRSLLPGNEAELGEIRSRPTV